MVAAGVTFEPPVLEYLERLAQEQERSRSWLLNRIVKDHAMRQGVDLAKETSAANAKE